MRSEYFNTPITVLNGKTVKPIEVFLMILKYCIMHSLCYSAFINCIRLLNNCYGQELIPTSIDFFNKLFDGTMTIEFHIVCPDCESDAGNIRKLAKNFNVNHVAS